MISVVIPTRNRADLLASALGSIINQDLPSSNFEIFVIDNGSTDNTQQIVNRYKKQIANLSCIYVAEPGLHNGRHAGMSAANGDILVFADDDIQAFPTWLSSIESSFTDPRVSMVGGNNYPLFVTNPPDWLSQLWDKPTFHGYKSIPSLSIIEFNGSYQDISPYLIWGCNFAIRKEVLMQAGGFHPDGMPKELIRFRGDGETHVSRYVAEAGLKSVYHPGASVYHTVLPQRMTYEYFRERGFNQGVSDSYTKLRQQDQFTPSSNLPFIRRALGFLVREVHKLLDSAETKFAMAQLQLGYAEGYAYHQASYRDDPEVRAWVHQTTYLK